MKYISNGKYDKNMTRTLEEYADFFYDAMKFERITNKNIFRVLRYCEDEIICYRFIDEILQEDLENQQGNFLKLTMGKNWFISAMQRDKYGNSYIFALYSGISENITMKEYIYYQLDCFFKNLCDLANKKSGDRDIYIMNMLYENAIAFVDRKISNIINMSMTPHVILAESISKISYLPYEGNNVNYKYMVCGNKRQTCDIAFFNDSITLDNHKQIRKLLEITYKENDDGLYLVCCGNKVKGYIAPKNLEDEFYLIEFNGTGKWSFGCQGSDKNKLIFEDKTVKLFKDDDKKKFCSCYRRIFESDVNMEAIWNIVENAKCQKHGTMLLFTENASDEAKRLYNAGYPVSVENMNARWIEAVGEIDGAMLLDQYGKLYMIGVILDGEMPPRGVSTGRGARYNSAVKYSYSHKSEKHLLVVISEDGYFNVINYNDFEK